MKLILEPWLDQLATRDPTPAGGSLALATLAGAAALCAKCARLSREPGESAKPFTSYATDFVRYAIEDCDDYAALTSGDSDRIDEALANGFRHARAAVSFLEEANGLKNSCKPALLADLQASCALARTSAKVLLDNLSINLEQLAKTGLNTDPHTAHLSSLRERLKIIV